MTCWRGLGQHHALHLLDAGCGAALWDHNSEAIPISSRSSCSGMFPASCLTLTPDRYDPDRSPRQTMRDLRSESESGRAREREREYKIERKREKAKHVQQQHTIGETARGKAPGTPAREASADSAASDLWSPWSTAPREASAAPLECGSPVAASVGFCSAFRILVARSFACKRPREVAEKSRGRH